MQITGLVITPEGDLDVENTAICIDRKHAVRACQGISCATKNVAKAVQSLYVSHGTHKAYYRTPFKVLREQKNMHVMNRRRPLHS
jgi:hypothetical protein